MASVVDPRESPVGDPLFDPLAVRWGQNLVVTTPQQRDRDVDAAQQVLVFGGVLFAELPILPVERGLAVGAEPGAK